MISRSATMENRRGMQRRPVGDSVLRRLRACQLVAQVLPRLKLCSETWKTWRTRTDATMSGHLTSAGSVGALTKLRIKLKNMTTVIDVLVRTARSIAKQLLTGLHQEVHHL